MDKLRINSLKNYFERLQENYDRNFIVLLLSFYFCVKGFLTSSVGLVQLPFLKNVLKVNETTYQIFILIAWTPWSMKAFFGSISDLVPLFGYHKKFYMLIASILGSIALILLSILNFSGRELLVPILLFLVMVKVSVIDLLCEAKYAKEMKKNQSGGEAVTFVWGCMVLGSFLSSIFVGIFTDYFNPQIIFAICLPFALQIIVPISRNYMNEARIPNEKRVQWNKIKKTPYIFVLAMAMAVLALGMAVVNTTAGNHLTLIYAISSSLIICVLAWKALPRSAAICNLFLFLIEATYVQIPGALDYWYTADSSCVPGGPNFNMTYYITYTNMIGSLASIGGLILFQVYLSRWSFRWAFLTSSLMRIMSSLFDLFIVSRWNLKVGIPDKEAYMLGDGLIMNTASMMASMPAVIMTAQLVNDGIESTTYAILAGFQNFGSNVSQSIGVAMMGYFSIDADVRPCKFSSLPELIFIAHFVMPLIPILLTFFVMKDLEAMSSNNNNNVRGEEMSLERKPYSKVDSRDDLEEMETFSSSLESEEYSEDEVRGEITISDKDMINK